MCSHATCYISYGTERIISLHYSHVLVLISGRLYMLYRCASQSGDLSLTSCRLMSSIGRLFLGGAFGSSPLLGGGGGGALLGSGTLFRRAVGSSSCSFCCCWCHLG